MNNIIILIILLSILFAGCTDLIVEPKESKNNVDDFEITWEAVNSIYPLLDYKGIDWDSIYTIYSLHASQAKGDEIQELIFDLLKELRDPHVTIISNGGGFIRPYTAPRLLRDKDLYSPLIVRNYFNKELKLAINNTIEYEILENNKGYIYISNFNNQWLMEDFDKVLDYVKNTKGLIIDIRQNTGGNSKNFKRVIGRFIESPLEIPANYSKGGIPFDESSILPHEGFIYKNPIVVLINGASISAGEVFPEILKQLPNVTAIGDTTAGGGANDVDWENIQGEYTLFCSMTIRISTIYVLRYDSVPIEWNGVLPDIRIENTKDDINQGRDKQLEYAIQYLE